MAQPELKCLQRQSEISVECALIDLAGHGGNRGWRQQQKQQSAASAEEKAMQIRECAKQRCERRYGGSSERERLPAEAFEKTM